MAACGPPACTTERLINNTCFGSAGTTPAACGCLVCSLNAKNSTYLSPHVRSSSEYKIHCQAASWTAVASLHSAARYRTISSWPRHELKLYALYHLRCHLQQWYSWPPDSQSQWRMPALLGVLCRLEATPPNSCTDHIHIHSGDKLARPGQQGSGIPVQCCLWQAGERQTFT